MNPTTGSCAVVRRHLQGGLSLIELMVAIAIGIVLIFGATQMYSDSRNAYAVNESVARLQETARYALSVIEPDVRMANFWGLTRGTQKISGKASQTDPVASVAAGAAANACGNNFAVDIDTNLQGTNNSYSFACAASPAAAVAASDTLTVRRASISAAVATLRVCTTRTAGTLVNDSSGCDVAPIGEVQDLLVHSYYVDTASSISGSPSLHRKQLIVGPAFQDDEVIPGIEDMQIQFGISTSATDLSATKYVNPDDVPAGATIVSVRIWLLVRSDTPEVGFVDNRVYEYGDRLLTSGATFDLNNPAGAGLAFRPADSTDESLTSVKHYRRLLVSRTIQVRNSV
jgi:type IV pilus assembly protein PilW